MQARSINIIIKNILSAGILFCFVLTANLEAQDVNDDMIPEAQIEADSLSLDIEDDVISETNQNGSDSTEVKKKSPQTAMICALIFPGLGQLYNGKKLKALILGGAEIGLLINSIYLNQMYKKSTIESEREFYIQNRNLSTWYLVGVVLYNILDAFVDAHMYSFDESKDLSFRIDPTKNDPKVMLSLSVNF